MPLIQFNVGGIKKTAFFSFIPKTGGTALIQAFRNLGARIYLHEENNPVVGVLRCPSQHFEYKLSSSIIDISAADHAFTVVRHPFDRAKSDYKWAFRNATQTKNIPWLDQWLEIMLEKYKNNSYIFDNHLRPQTEFIGDGIKNIYRYEESLEAVIELSLKKLNLKPKNNLPRLPRANTSSQMMTGLLKRHSKKQMSNALQIVKQHYQKDFKTLGYE